MRPNEVGKLGFVTGEADAIVERGAFRQRVGVMAEGFEEVEQKRLRLAFLVALELGGKLSELMKGAFP